jgi:hypothetical protein
MQQHVVGLRLWAYGTAWAIVYGEGKGCGKGALMKRRTWVHLSMVLLFAVSLVLTSAATTAIAADSGTVSGTVELDGKPLPDVEVFLWVGHPRLTCTDSSGEFLFEDVPFNVGLLSATGFGSPERCKNFRFRAPDGTDLLTEFYNSFNAFFVTVDNPDYVIEYTPRLAKSDEKVCAGYLATVIGTDGDDVLETSPGKTVVYGGAGNDVIKGSAEPFEHLCGGLGQDTLYGYGGPDVLLGGPGFDRLFGGAGEDVLLGEGRRDVIRGGAGDDIIWGFAGNDTLLGGKGKDIIRGQAGDDVLKGNMGWDRLYGGTGDDAAYGGPGNDKCWAESKVSC